MSSEPTPTSRFANASRLAALLWLTGAFALLVWGLIASLSLHRWPIGSLGTPDVEFYRNVVERVRGGQSYYDAFDRSTAGWELSSAFNCRPPTYAWFLSLLPDLDWYYGLLLALSLASVIASVRVLVAPWSGSKGQIAALVLLIGGAFSWTVYEHDSFLTTEPWCEVFLLLSICAYACGRWPIGMALIVASLSLRELVLPWAVVAWAIALWRRRRLEWSLWTVVLLAFLVLLYLHVQEVARRHPELPGASVSFWTKTHGIEFVLRSSVMNVLLRPLPPQLAAVFLPLALLGLAGWPGETGTRMFATAATYVTAYLFMQGGEYWGYLYTPLLVLGLVRSPAAVRDLWRTARPRRSTI